MGAGGLKGTCYTEKVDLWIERPLELIGTKNYLLRSVQREMGLQPLLVRVRKITSFLSIVDIFI